MYRSVLFQGHMGKNTQFLVIDCIRYLIIKILLFLIQIIFGITTKYHIVVMQNAEGVLPTTATTLKRMTLKLKCRLISNLFQTILIEIYATIASVLPAEKTLAASVGTLGFVNTTESSDKMEQLGIDTQNYSNKTDQRISDSYPIG